VSLFQLVSKALGKKVPKINKKAKDEELILDNTP
jgi:hypothetical protein